MKKNILVLALIACTTSTWAQGKIIVSPADSAKIEHILHTTAPTDSIREVLVAIGKQFIGTPYGAHTLEGPQEDLRIRTDSLDCVTFLETTFALALTTENGGRTLHDFAATLQKMRYRNGKIDGYTSRIHYFTEWIAQAEQLGMLRNITQSIGGVPYKKQLGIMTANWALNPAMSSDEVSRAILAMEKRVSKLKNFYIPSAKIAEAEAQIQDGDLIALTSSSPLADIAHVGIALKIDGRLYFMHASSTNKHVEISAKPLADDIALAKRFSGIMVMRPLKWQATGR